MIRTWRLASGRCAVTISVWVLIWSLSGFAFAQPSQPFSARYKANFGGVPITATRTLKTLDNGHQELRFAASSWLGDIVEFSRFSWGENGQLIPQRYEYHRTGLGRERDAVLSFDWGRRRVTNDVASKVWVMDIPEQVQDKLSYQEQLRRDLLGGKPVVRYAVADGGHVKHYLFETLGEETLNTPVGKFKTVKVRRTREKNSRRITYLWLAKDWDYLVVRIQQREKDGKPYEITLSEGNVNGVPVKGF